MKLGWKGAVGIAISAFLIWFTLRGEDLGEIWSLIRDADFLLLGAAVFVATFGFFIRALRWKVLLTPLDPNTSLRARYGAVNIGFMANNLLPARVGEFARAVAFARLQPSVTAGGAFGSLVVERLLDGMVLIGLLVGTVFWPGFPSDGLGDRYTEILIGAVTLLGGVFLVALFLIVFPRPTVRILERLAGLLPDRFGRPIVEALEAFLTALGVLKSPRLLVQAALWSVGFWLWHGLSFWLGMLAFDIDTGLVSAFFVEAVVGFGVALPAAPGFFGTFHVSVQFALETVYGVAAAPVLAFAYAYHLGGFIPVTLIGLWYAREVGMSLGDVGSAGETVEEKLDADFAPEGSGPTADGEPPTPGGD